MDWSPFQNRLKKNDRHLHKWAKRHGFEAYRVYDRDIPEYNFIVDRYRDHAVIFDRRESDTQDGSEVVPVVGQALDVATTKLHLKKRERQRGQSQYERLGQTHQTLSIKEGLCEFLVNLDDYLDTGLFLDHRPIRQELVTSDSLHGKRFLNLFCYTGAVSVAAAKAGALCTSVDLSQTYLDWAQANFERNGLKLKDHSFVRTDITSALTGNDGASIYDLIFLDPPTFSNSKSMKQAFDVKQHHPQLINGCMARLDPKGLLIFSTNSRSFRLADSVTAAYDVNDRTASSIPIDFRDKKIHRCFEIRHF